ncbi:hypothetical protein PC128_g25423 [Phytophthora cactorum]|nr:hypothetical protein PC128_g25423 [Phytophthora cactorum]
MQNSTMSDENFAAGLAWIACREGDDLELSQDDRAANARKTSPWTSYVEVQKSNSKHKAKAFASRKRSRDTSDNESDSLAPPPKHPASGKQSVSRPITKSLAASNAPLLLQGKQLQPHPWFARQHRQVFPSLSHSLDQQKLHRRKVSPRHCELHPRRHRTRREFIHLSVRCKSSAICW